jgi:integrase
MRKLAEVLHLFVGEIAYMNAPTSTIGNQIDADVRVSSQSCNISHRKPRTVQDLLTAFCGHKQLPMLRTTAGHISDCLNVPFDQLTTDALVGLNSRFTTYLEGRRYKRNAIRSYRNYVNVLLRKAKELGWTPEHPEVPEVWEPIIAALAEVKPARGIVRYAISIGKTPSTFTDDDLSAWAQMMLSQKGSYGYVRQLQHIFRREIARAGLAGHLPGIFRNWKPATKYFVPLKDFPPELRQEALAVLHWKQAPYAKGRRAKSKIRPISAVNLENAITGQYGFLVRILPHLPESAVKIDPASIKTLPELFTQDSASAFIDWWINNRKLQGQSLVSRLATICAALKEYPSYSDEDFTWFDELLREIPLEAESCRRERKEQKYLSYETVAEIPRKIHETRTEAATRGVKALAQAVHDELFMTWLVMLVWRQRNIRECRIGQKSEGANLFKAEVEQWDNVKKPRWVQERLRINPREQFWQYHFREHETKNGREVRSILPRRLVSLLEEFLEHHRQYLVNGEDPGTLFVSRAGHRMTPTQVTSLVSNLTLRHAGRRATPHIFRDIWANWWLASHPEDYLTVSKKLWHRTVEITLRIYGCKFDEAQADCRVEDYLDAEG